MIITRTLTSVCVAPDPHADSHAGHDPELKLRIVYGTKPTGWFWQAQTLGVGLWKGPYSTSEAAYDGFHEYMGWVRMDKEQR